MFPTAGGQAQSYGNVLQRGWYRALKPAGIYDWKTKTGKPVAFTICDTRIFGPDLREK